MSDTDIVRVTYAELARARGVTLAAARRMAQRHRWPKQVGNDGLSRISVPATFLTRPESVDTDVCPDIINYGAPDVATDTEKLRVVALDDAMTALADVVRNATTDVATDVARNVVKDVIVMLREQLIAERERADHAEGRIRDLQDKLEAEMIEHRRVVGLLTEQLAARRRWWPWRR